MKVFERCIKTSLLSVCEEFLDPRQHGFLNNKSCVTQMIPFANDFALTVDTRSRTDVIYFDFAKAFDSVSHDLILRKLKTNFKIEGLMLNFVKSYLKGRRQQVLVGGQLSSELPVLSGVPQGSILGPLLFVMFINDVFSCVSPSTNIALYADDTKIWRSILKFEDHFALQNDINNLFNWSVKNKMVFHPKKCKALSLTHQRNVLDNLPFNIFIFELNGSDIDYVSSQRDLGVNISTNLNWGLHHDLLVQQANSKLGLLRRTCPFTTDKKQKRTFVRSLFEHCSQLSSPQYPSHILKFESIQRRAIKWINGEPFTSYSEEKYAEELRKHNILPLKLKFAHNDLSLFYKIINQLVPINLSQHVIPYRVENRRHTRQNASVHSSVDVSRFHYTLTPKSDALKNSFFYRTVRLWNTIPANITQSECLNSFKTSLYNYL